MNIESWIIVGTVVVFSIISSIIKALRQQSEQPVCTNTDTEETDYLIEEYDNIEGEFIEEQNDKPKRKKKTVQKTIVESPKEEPTDDQHDESDLKIDLTDADEARRAFIASEIFNKKY